MDYKYFEDLCNWIKNEKGIKKIHILELTELDLEYKEWLERQK